MPQGHAPDKTGAKTPRNLNVIGRFSNRPPTQNHRGRSRACPDSYLHRATVPHQTVGAHGMRPDEISPYY
jgi:hypothetical protein